MAESRNVRDVPAEEFIKAYAAHLRSNDKVNLWVKAGDQEGAIDRRRRQPSSSSRSSSRINALPRPGAALLLRSYVCGVRHREAGDAKGCRGAERPWSRALLSLSPSERASLDRGSEKDSAIRREALLALSSPCSRPMNGPEHGSSVSEA